MKSQSENGKNIVNYHSFRMWKNSKPPQGKKETAWGVYLQIDCTYASNITKPASSGFTKGKYTLKAEIIHSKMELWIKITFHVAFTSPHNLEAKQQQMKEKWGKEEQEHRKSFKAHQRCAAVSPWLHHSSYDRLQVGSHSSLIPNIFYLSYKLQI